MPVVIHFPLGTENTTQWIACATLNMCGCVAHARHLFYLFYFVIVGHHSWVPSRDYRLVVRRLKFSHVGSMPTVSLNREAQNFEFTHFLVAHWQGQKNSKKPDSTGKKGHIGCSPGYNYNLYKKHIGININSQNREIMHSQLEKCVTSLKLKSYPDFMSWMVAFFAIRNLSSMNLI